MIQQGPIIYNLFPLLAGPFENWAPHLERARSMGFTWLYFNPVSYPGFSGSLYSVKDYYGFHPLLAPHGDVKGRRAFAGALHTMHHLGLAPMMDLVINHTAIDCPLIATHPGWFHRDGHGNVVHPGVREQDGRWVEWGDLASVDNAESADRDTLWAYWNRLIAHHQELGVKGFRCDAAYQVPAALWHRLITQARQRDPQVAFFAETLGCPIEDVLALAQAGFDFTFNSSKWWDFVAPWCLDQYQKTAPMIGTISFPESHDTPRLAAECDRGMMLTRYAFAALFSTGLMMPMGFEHAASRALDVVKTRPEDWETPADLTEIIREINVLKGKCPVFNQEGPITLMPGWDAAITGLHKHHETGEDAFIVIRRAGGESPAPMHPPLPPHVLDVTPARLLAEGAAIRIFITLGPTHGAHSEGDSGPCLTSI